MNKGAKVLGVMALTVGILGIGSNSALARLASNRLGANRLSSNRLGANRLASNRLASNGLTVDASGAGDLLATSDGRDVLSYLVSCALPADITLHATVDGTTYDFPGNLGLAPTWLHKPLNREGKGWVSACMLARVNAHDTAEEISLRGAHPALTISPDEAALYTVEEGAFYGNLFRPADKPVVWIACRGRDQAAGEFGGLVLRDCAEPDPNDPHVTQCGFTFAGDCGDFATVPQGPGACEEFGAGDDDEPTIDHGLFYSVCHDEADACARHPKEFDQVITTFTAP